MGYHSFYNTQRHPCHKKSRLHFNLWLMWIHWTMNTKLVGVVIWITIRKSNEYQPYLISSIRPPMKSRISYFLILHFWCSLLLPNDNSIFCFSFLYSFCHSVSHRHRYWRTQKWTQMSFSIMLSILYCIWSEITLFIQLWQLFFDT